MTVMDESRENREGLSRRRLLKYGLYGGAGLGLPAMLNLIGCGKKRPIRRPNIILIILDTTRADRLSCYGYERKTSPNIDKLAAESVLYSRVQLWINGYQTVDYTEPDGTLEQRGVIGLQIHSGGPSEAWYKDIRIKEL